MNNTAARLKFWGALKTDASALAEAGEKLLFRVRPGVGWAFIATLRKDVAPCIASGRRGGPATDTAALEALGHPGRAVGINRRLK